MNSSRVVRNLWRLAIAFVTVASASAATSVSAQTAVDRAFELRGVVRDSASRAPIAGAVVMALDEDGQMVVRTIAGERGIYRMSRPANATQLRVVRLGFRPVTLAMPLVRGELTTLDVAMTAVARGLAAVDVVAARGCPVRNDRAEAFALLDQARAGLLATVVARERQPAALHVLRYERRLDLDGIEIERQTVQLDSSKNATTSFNAVQTALDFVERGFRIGRDGQYTYYGPDADVLLDERFQRGYCFTLAPSDTLRATQVGLHFGPASRRSGRVDIDGTLWIDTTARALTDIEFRYQGLEVLAESFGAGGRIGFRTLPSGVPFIDRWTLRLIGAPDTTFTDSGLSSQNYAIREIGGELAEARWPDGQVWRAPLGSALITAVRRDGTPARGVHLQLVGTDYRATTDSLGRATIDRLVPGPYKFAADDSLLAPIALQLPITRTFVARRVSSSLLRIEVPTAEQYVQAMCSEPVPLGPNDAMLVTRVVGSDNQPLGGMHWRLSESRDSRWRVISDNGITASSGLVFQCRGIERGALVEMTAWRELTDAVRVRRAITDRVTALRLPFATRAVVAQQTAKDAARVTVTGMVRDSASGALVNEARVTFLGSPFEGATDSTGQFLVGGVPQGEYTVEVSTPFLDSIGAVSRTDVTLRDSVTRLSLFVPSLTAIMSSACGAVDLTGAVLGRLTSTVPTATPARFQVVAEWNDGTARWLRVPVESNGTYRLCGVPANVELRIRTESDSAQSLAAAPAQVRVSTDRRFARVDLRLDSAVVTLPVFSGTVIADSLGTPLANAQISLTDVERSVTSDARGGFRLVDIPVGAHVVSIRKVGHAPFITSMNFEANRTLEQRVLLPPSAATLAEVNITANGAPAAFDERRRNGVGRYLTAEQLAPQGERRLADVLMTVPSVNSVRGRGGNGWIIGKRAPQHIKPTGSEYSQKGQSCGSTAITQCRWTDKDLVEQGIYCPNAAEAKQGIECACYAQVFVDNHLMNGGRPTEPFDVNTIPTKDVAGIEFYASPAQTPGQYSSLLARCGVMLIWTRR